MSIINERFELGTFSLKEKSEYEIESIIEQYYQYGGRYIDTAIYYGGRNKEIILAKILRKYKDMRVSSKIGYYKYIEDYRSYDYIYNEAQKTIENFEDQLHVLRVHEADWSLWWKREIKDLTKVEIDDSPVIRAMSKIFQQHNYIKIGISGNNAKNLRKLIDLKRFDNVMIAKQYDLLWRNTRHYLVDYKYIDQTTLVVAAPFHQGHIFNLNLLMQTISKKEVCASIVSLQKIIDESGMSIPDLTMKFLLKDNFISRIAFGVNDVRELCFLKDVDGVLDECIYQKILDNGFLCNALSGKQYLPQHRQ